MGYQEWKNKKASSGYEAWKEKKRGTQATKTISSETKTAMESVTSRVNSWMDNYRSYLNDYNSRVAKRTGGQYLSDSDTFSADMASRKSALDTEADEIRTLMKENQDYLDMDWVYQVNAALRSAGKQQSRVLDLTQEDSKFWASFNPTEEQAAKGITAEDIYKRSYNESQWRKKYGGSSYDGAQMLLRNMEDGEEKQWLENYAFSKVTAEELQAKRDAADNEDDRLKYQSLLNQKEVTNAAEALGQHQMEGTAGTILDELLAVAQMEDGAEKRTRKKAVTKAMEAAGIDPDTYYSLITGDSNFTMENLSGYIESKASAGLVSVGKAVTGLLDFTLGKAGRAIGWDNGIGSLDQQMRRDYNAYAYNAELYKNRMGGGKVLDAVGAITEGTVAAIPQALMAMASAGTTTGMTLSENAAMATGNILTRAGLTTKAMLTNPSYWMSFGQTFSSDYEDALAKGADDVTAAFGATITSLINAGLEIGIDGTSGIQGLPQKLTDGDSNAILEWVKSSLEEGGEEVMQSFVNNAVSKIAYDPNTKLVEPQTMLEDFALGTAVGGLLGGGQRLAMSGINAGLNTLYQAGKDYQPRQAITENAETFEAVQNPVAQDVPEGTVPANVQQVTGKLTAEESSVVGKDTNVLNKTAEDGPVTLEEASKKYGAQAGAMQHTYNAGQDVTLYDHAYQLAYDMGKNGVKLEYVKNSESVGYLTEIQKELAYEAGAFAAQQEREASAAFEKFTAIDGGKAMVQIGSQEVNAAEVTLPDAGENLVLHSVAGFSNISPEAANAVMQAYQEGKVSAEAFSIGAEQAYRWGYYGYSQKKLAAQEEAAQLTEAQRSAVYQAGRDAAAHYYAQTQKTATGKTTATVKKGSVYYGYDGETMDTSQASGLTEQQRVGVEFARKLAKSRGMTIYFYESYVDEGGNRVYMNQNGEIVPAHKGYYDPSDGSIHLDLNAGETGQGTVLFTIAHELTHFIRDWSGTHFKKLADIVVEKYGEWELSVDEAVKQQQIDAEAAGRELSYDDAFEEVVASSMENILTDGKVMEFMAEMEQKDKTLADKVKEFFRDIMDLIRDTINAYKNISPESFEANVTAQMEDVLEQLEQIFAEGVYEGGENYRRAEKSTTGEGGVKYSFVGYAEDGRGVYMSNFPKGTPKKAKGERILQYIQNVWSKNPIALRIDDGNDVRYIEANFDPTFSEDTKFKTDASKLMGGNRHGNAVEQRVTLDLADDYYQIASESQYNYSKEETGKNSETHRDVKVWHYFINDIYFAEYDSDVLEPYRISINVKEKENGHFFYSFSAEKAEGTSTRRTLHADVSNSDTATANGSSSKPSIRRSNENVKVKLSARKDLNTEALAYFGRTYSWKETGYLLTDGSKLDFSGRHEGASGGYRTVDHRDILDIYPEDTELDGNGAMVDFMQQGNIRISPEGDGINLQVQPTKAQERSLDDFISRARGWVTLDIDDARGNTVVSVEYPRGTRASKVLQDIRNFFESGAEPQISKVAQFHYSARYQRRRDAAQILETENAKLQKEVGYLRQLLKLQRTVTGGTKFTKSSVEQMARMLKESAGAKGNTQELAEMLNGFYEFIATDKELTWESVKEKAQPIVSWLQNHVQMKNRRSEYAQDILSHLHGSRIYLDESQKAEAAHRYGSFDAYRKRAMGSIVIAKEGSVSLDSKWQELAQMYPDMFDAETTSTDMPGALMDALDRLRNTDTTALEYFHNRDLIAQDLLRQVYDSYWRVSTLYTVADVKQKEIDSLKSRHMERMADMRADFNARVDKMKTQHREAMRQRDSQWKKRLENQQKEISGRYEQTQKNKADGRKKKEMRMKIRKVIRDLDKILNRGDKKRNVKEDMKDFVAKALSSAEVLFTDYHSNEDIIRNGFGVELTEAEAKYAEEAKAILKEMAMLPTGSYEAWQERQETEKTLQSRLDYRMAKLKDAFTRERQRLDKATVSSVLRDLADSYAKLEDAEHAYVNGAYHESVHEYLKMLQEDMGGATVKNMTLNQLEELHKAYTMVLTTVQNANKMFAEGLTQGRSETANSIMTEVYAAGGEHGLWSKSEISRNRASWNNTKPIYAAERLGSPTFAKVFSGLFQGQYQWATDMDEAKAFRQKIADKYGSKNWDMEKLYSFTSSSGIDFQLNLNQIMSLYAYSKREQAHEHLLKGGFVFGKNTEVVVTEHGIKRTYLNKSAKAHNVSDAILADIVSNLTKEQKGFVDEMQDYLSTTMGAKGNEVSMRLYGVKLFLEKYYFPLRSAGQFKEKAKEAELKQQQGHISIANSGFTHGTKPKASNAVVLDGFTDVWASHVNEMSMYHAMVLPMEDFRRVYNYASPNMEGEETVSVNSVIENAYGDAATGYFDQLYKELNGGAITDPRETAFKERIGKFKKAAVMLSSSVVVQQFSAVGRTFALIDPKHFIGPKVDQKRHKMLWAEMKQYAPVATIKEMGGFDTHTGGSAKDFLLAEEYEKGERLKALREDKQYRDEIMGLAPAMADELTWCTIWAAVKREIKAQNPKMDTQSEVFLRKVGERFSEVIEKTQVYDSVLARSANMRSKNGLLQMATAFMAEPTTTANMVEDAIRKGNKKQIARTLGAVATSIVLNNALASMVYAMRDDDEDETFMEKYSQAFASGMLDDMNPLTYYPFLKDVWSLLQGYDVERSDMSVVADVVDAAKKLATAISKYDEDMDEEEFAEYYKGIGESLLSVLDAGCSALGIPVKNVRREILSLMNTGKILTEDIFGERDTTWNSFWDAVGAAALDAIPVVGLFAGESKGDKLYDAIVSGDAVYAERLKGSYKSESSYNTAIRKALRENDPRIRDAAVAWNANNLDKYMQIAKAIIAEKHFSQDDVVSAIRATASSLASDEETTATAAKAKGIFTAEKFASAIAQGNAKMAKAVKEDIIQIAQINGKTSEEAEKSFADSAKSAMKEMFLAGTITEEQVIQGLRDHCGLTQLQAKADVQYWTFKQQYPDTYAADSWFDAYYEDVEASGVGIKDYMDYRNAVKDITGEGKKERRMDVIDSLPITKAQKDALYYAEGWAESTIDEAPWH